MKKTIAILLILMFCLSAFVACSDAEEAPDGYQLVANEGDCFRLYVPTQGWMPNITGGATGAIFSMAQNAAVNVYPVDDAEGLSLDAYWEQCNARFADELKEYSYEGKAENVILGGQPAKKHLFSARITTVNNGIETETLYKFLLVMASYREELYLLVYHAPEEYYDTHIETVEGDADGKGIIPYFQFAEPYAKDEKPEYSDKVEVPAGMRLISTEELPYRFFVPEAWEVNTRAEFPAAKLSDGANVSAQMYMTGDESKTVADYFAECEKRYEKLFESYELLTSEEIKMDGISAMQYTYTVVSGGVEYRQLQAIVMKGAVYYTVTYTATPDVFDSHLPDVEKMIESFDIR